MGKSAEEAAEILRTRYGNDTDVAAIGPARENLVRFACIGHFWKGRSGTSGRGGLGAVLGSKGIKAIVVRGDRKTEVAHPEKLRALVTRQRETLKKGTAGLSEFGTPVLVPLANSMGPLEPGTSSGNTLKRPKPSVGEY